MNLLNKDYRKQYLLQDKFLACWKELHLPFYLTGGTALSRFYLHHRYSEDIDFFVHSDPNFVKYISVIKDKLSEGFSVDNQKSLFTEDYTRFYITDENINLKIEFVNDIPYRSGVPVDVYFGKLDTPANILSNKIGAILSRDEPKDIFDIVSISMNYNFNWRKIFEETKRKTAINEIDVEIRLNSFPVDWLSEIDWLVSEMNGNVFRNQLNQIAEDFLLGKDNTLGKGKINIYDAMPNLLNEEEINKRKGYEMGGF
jgi:predicted nucleotidyltransferase component of viral defense system